MESDLTEYHQVDYGRTVAEADGSVETSKPNVYDDYLKSMKYLETDGNVVDPVGPLYPGVSMVYPINPWTFWYRDRTKSHPGCPWEESLTRIETVRDVTRLWKILNHMVLRSSAKLLNANVFVFAENSEPAWEHESNENAGCWTIILNNNDNLHNTWNDMILQVVGDKFAPVATDINGIGLHVKPKCSKITVWTTKTTIDNYKNILKIGIMSKQIFGHAVKHAYYAMHNRLARSL